MSEEKDGEDSEWLFDYLLLALKAPTFDYAIMDFIDEHCIIFDNEEENKFVYTDLHNQFRDLVERLLMERLEEVGIGTEKFIEACSNASFARRDINQQVYDQILAMEDFLVFKKLMVKRNIELELEALQALREEGNPIPAPCTREEEEEQYQLALQESADLDKVERRRAERVATAAAAAKDNSDEAASLLEIELEQVELEKAIALSLAVEEERLRLLQLEAKHEDDAKGGGGGYGGGYVAEAEKEEDQRKTSVRPALSNEEGVSEEKMVAVHHDDEKAAAEGRLLDKEALTRETENDSRGSKGRRRASEEDQESGETRRPSLRQLPPLQFRKGPGPALGSSKQEMADLANQELQDRRAQAMEAFNRNQEFLKQKQKELIENQAAVSPGEMERRANYLREQRDRIVAKKKADREATLQKHKEDTGHSTTPKAEQQIDRIETEEESEEMIMKRNELRVALGLRLKQDLITTEQERLTKMEEDQFYQLDEQLELLREKQQQI